MKKPIILIIFLFLTETHFGQTLNQKNTIDSICIVMDTSKSIYRRVLMKVALRPQNESYDYNRYFIDTVNNKFLVVMAWREGSNLGRYYYFLNKKLLKVMYKEKNNGKYKAKAALYFKNRKLIYNDDKYRVTKTEKETLMEAQNFLDFVKSIVD